MPSVDVIQEEDENGSNLNTPQATQKNYDGNGSEISNSDPEADQIEMNTKETNIEPPCELDDTDGAVTFAALPSNDHENKFEIKEPRIPTLHMSNNNQENEFEKNDIKLPKLRIIRILGGMFLSFAILALLAVPLGTHFVAKERKISYLYYEIPPKGEDVKETHIIQVIIAS